MGYTRLAIYLGGVAILVLAAWVLLTQTGIADVIPVGVVIAVMLLIVGIGVIAASRSVDDRRFTRRVVHDGSPMEPGRRVVHRTYEDDVDTTYAEPRETIVEERRYD